MILWKVLIVIGIFFVEPCDRCDRSLTVGSSEDAGMDSDTIVYVKAKRRLTRRESQEETRGRLIEAAARLFVRRGFEGASVEEIAEEAGYSRGAFYSNFKSKDELFLAVLRAKRGEVDGALGEIVSREKEPAGRLAAVLDWYVHQDLNKDWVILEAEFTLRAYRNRAARARIGEFNKQRVAEYSALAARHFAESGTKAPARPETIAMSLFAVAKGLAELALLDGSEGGRKLYAECRDLVFHALIPNLEDT